MDISRSDLILGYFLLTISSLVLIVYSVRFKKLIWFPLVALGAVFLFSSLAFLSSGLILALFVLRITAASIAPGKINQGQQVEGIKLFKTYLLSFSTITFTISAASFGIDFLLNPEGTGGIDLKYFILLIPLLVLFSFSYLLSKHKRTFVEDLAGIIVLDTSEHPLTFAMALLRYAIILSTFPLLFGLGNFFFKVPLYNSATNAVEYKNDAHAISDGWLFRSFSFIVSKARQAKLKT